MSIPPHADSVSTKGESGLSASTSTPLAANPDRRPYIGTLQALTLGANATILLKIGSRTILSGTTARTEGPWVGKLNEAITIVVTGAFADSAYELASFGYLAGNTPGDVETG